MQRILNVEYSFPPQIKASEECRDLLERILVANPAERMGIPQIMQHPWSVLLCCCCPKLCWLPQHTPLCSLLAHTPVSMHCTNSKERRETSTAVLQRKPLNDNTRLCTHRVKSCHNAASHCNCRTDLASKCDTEPAHCQTTASSRGQEGGGGCGGGGGGGGGGKGKNGLLQ